MVMRAHLLFFFILVGPFISSEKEESRQEWNLYHMTHSYIPSNQLSLLWWWWSPLKVLKSNQRVTPTSIFPFDTFEETIYSSEHSLILLPEDSNNWIKEWTSVISYLTIYPTHHISLSLIEKSYLWCLSYLLLSSYPFPSFPHFQTSAAEEQNNFRGRTYLGAIGAASFEHEDDISDDIGSILSMILILLLLLLPP